MPSNCAQSLRYNAIVEARQPPSLTAKSLLECEWPLAWAEQRAMLGFS